MRATSAGRRPTRCVPRDGETMGEIVVRGNAVMKLPKTVTGKVQKHVPRGGRSATARQ
jgi:hypothetical protein